MTCLVMFRRDKKTTFLNREQKVWNQTTEEAKEQLKKLWGFFLKKIDIDTWNHYNGVNAHSEEKIMSKDKRSDVMQAAMRIIAENGFHNAPTSLIAEKAGVGMGTIYRYFKSKDELIHAIYNERLTITRQEVRKKYDITASLRDRHIKLCHNLFDYMVNNPLDFSFYEQYRNSPYCQTGQLENILAFEQSDSPQDYPFLNLFKEGQMKKEIKGLQYRLLFALALSPIFTLIGQTIAGVLQVNEEELEQTFAACWDAIASR